MAIFEALEEKRKRKSVLKTQKCKAHPMVRCETARHTHTVAFWNASLLRSAPGICTSNAAYQVQMENPCTLSWLSGAETPAHQRGFKCWNDESTGAWKKKTRSCFLRVLPHWPNEKRRLEEMSSWLHSHELWCGKILLFCQRERKIMLEKAFPSQEYISALIYHYKYSSIKIILQAYLCMPDRDSCNWHYKVYPVILYRFCEMKCYFSG